MHHTLANSYHYHYYTSHTLSCATTFNHHTGRHHTSTNPHQPNRHYLHITHHYHLLPRHIHHYTSDSEHHNTHSPTSRNKLHLHNNTHDSSTLTSHTHTLTILVLPDHSIAFYNLLLYMYSLLHNSDAHRARLVLTNDSRRNITVSHELELVYDSALTQPTTHSSLSLLVCTCDSRAKTLHVTPPPLTYGLTSEHVCYHCCCVSLLPNTMHHRFLSNYTNLYDCSLIEHSITNTRNTHSICYLSYPTTVLKPTTLTNTALTALNSCHSYLDLYFYLLKPTTCISYLDYVALYSIAVQLSSHILNPHGLRVLLTSHTSHLSLLYLSTSPLSLSLLPLHLTITGLAEFCRPKRGLDLLVIGQTSPPLYFYPPFPLILCSPFLYPSFSPLLTWRVEFVVPKRNNLDPLVIEQANLCLDFRQEPSHVAVHSVLRLSPLSILTPLSPLPLSLTSPPSEGDDTSLTDYDEVASSRSVRD